MDASVSASTARICDVDGVLLASPHEQAWRETLEQLALTDWAPRAREARFAPSRFTTALYQARVAGKPRVEGARAALEALGFADAGLWVRASSDCGSASSARRTPQARG